MVRRAIERAGGLDEIIDPGDHVVLKPNLVKDNWDGRHGIVTDARVCAAIVEVAREAGAGQVTISEGTAVSTSGAGRDCTWHAFDDAGYDGSDAYDNVFDYGDPVNYPVALFDLNDSGGLHQTDEDKVTHVTDLTEGVIRTEYYVPNILLECDVLISVPTFKNHGNGTVTLALKNRVGCAPNDIYHGHVDWGEGIYGKLSLVHYCDQGFSCTVSPAPTDQNEIVQRTLVDLNLLRPQDFAVVDALIGITNGPAPQPGNVQTPNPHMQMIIAGADSVAVDTVGALAMGYDPYSVPHVEWANSTGLLGTMETRYIDVLGDHVMDVRNNFPLNNGGTTPPVRAEEDPPWITGISWTEGQDVAQSPEVPISVTGIGDLVGVVKAELILTPTGVPGAESDIAITVMDPSVPDFDISWDAMGTPLGQYEAKLTVYDAVLNEASITRNITLVPPTQPVIHAQPKTFTHTVFVGESPDDDVFTIANLGVDTLVYDVELSDDWISLSSYAGTVPEGSPPDSITIDYHCESLAPGENVMTITASDDAALGSPQTITVTVNVETVAADLDLDGDVDQSDFGLLQACLSGSAGYPSGCANADLNKTGYVNQDDFNLFQECLSGPGVLPDKTCDDGWGG